MLFFVMIGRPPTPSLPDTVLPYATLFRSGLLGTASDNVDDFRKTQATAARAIAVGNGAQAHAEEGVALGVMTRVLTGADRAVAIGSDSVASDADTRSEEHTSELQSLMSTSYAVFCLTNKTYRPKHVN